MRTFGTILTGRFWMQGQKDAAERSRAAIKTADAAMSNIIHSECPHSASNTGMLFSFVRSLVVIFGLVAGVLAGTTSMMGSSAASANDVNIAPSDVVRGGSGLPVPRFVSLASNEVNMRTGPGRRYPIRWVYKRKGLPLKVEAEFDIWRKVRDADGEVGWIHGSLLSGRRTAQIHGETRNLYEKQNPASRVVLKAEPGVIGSILECETSWCRLLIAGKKGWIERSGFWGILPNE